MPEFFFNYVTENGTFEDELGVEFSSLEEAYLDTCKAALAISFEKLRARQDPARHSFQILDDQKNLLMEVPFSEVLKPTAVIGASPLKQKFALAMESCQRQLDKNSRLKEEIRAEFARARLLFGDIKAILSTPNFR